MKQYILIISICLFFIGVRLTLFYTSPSPYHIGQVVLISTRLLSEPTQKGNYQTFYIFAKGHYRVLVKISASESLHYGDSIVLKGILSEQHLGSTAVLILDRPILIHQKPSLLFSALSYFRQKSNLLYRSILSSDQAGLLLGIVYGIKSPMSYRFSQAIQSVGLTHVSAASGMNVTLLSGFLGTILVFFMKRQKTVGVILGILLMYMVLSGMQGSILRATVMGGGAIVAGLFGRQRQGIYLLCISAYMLLFFSPILLQDLGFQLSVLSTLGILLFTPLLETLVAGKLFLDDMATTLSAQILTLPLLLLTFGHYNLLSILVNMLVLWVVPPLMILGGLASILGTIVPVIGYLLLVISIPLLWYFQSVTLFFARFDTSITFSSIPLPFILSYYCLIGVGYLFIRIKKKFQAEM